MPIGGLVASLAIITWLNRAALPGPRRMVEASITGGLIMYAVWWGYSHWGR
jgi:hypothetical protein